MRSNFQKRLLIASLFAFSLLPVRAFACTPETETTSCIGQSCSPIGMTMLDADKVNIIACLYETTGSTTLIWKSMSGGSTVSGAVMAFALASCPTGWSAFTPLNGRTIIGTGSSGATGATSHWFGQADGEETHTLSTTEMPYHNHSPIHLEGSVSNDGNEGAEVITNFTGAEVWGTTDIMNSYTGYAGGNGPHNNMQPYLALTFCSKN